MPAARRRTRLGLTTPAGAPLDPAARAALQRRTLRVLSAGQVVGAAALTAAVTVGAFVIQNMLGRHTPWAGLATATVTIGTAFMSQALSRMMQRRGRRVGLQRGYGLAVIGGVLAATAVELDWLPLFLAGLFLYGNGQAANLLARYAATDLADADQRSQAMSRIVFASTFGAVLGPLLIGPAERAGQSWFGFEKYTGPWVFSAVIFAAAMLNIAARLRPDPLHVAATAADLSSAPPSVRGADAINAIRRSRDARLALAAMVVSHATMVAVMTMTPVHLKLHGHEGVSTIVVSTHIAGMYAFSPLVGRFSDRRGRLPTIVVGSVLLIAATMLAALSGDVEQLLFPALWALGLGWSFGLIGGSSLLVDSVRPAERVSAQGAADLSMSLCAGIAGFSSGFIRRAVGFHMLANLATMAAVLLFVVAYAAQRRHVTDTAAKDRRRGAFTQA